MKNIIDFIYYVTGITDVSWYNFWSGIFADITIFGGAFIFYRNHKCKTCFRIAKHSVKGTPYKTCHRHATESWHRKLHHEHSVKYPSQHSFFKKR